MVDVTNIQNTAGQTIQQGMSSMYLLVIIFLLLGIVFGTAFFIMWWNSYKIKFRVFVITGTKSLIVDRFAKIIRKKGQSPKWKLRGGDYVPVPRPDEIGIDKKGRMCVEAHFTESGEYIYKKHINDAIQDENNFDPLTPIDKEFYSNEYVDGVQKYKKKGWAEILLQLAPYIMIFLIFVMFLVFWGKIIEPYQEMGNQIVAEREADREFMLEMHDIHRVVVGNKTVERGGIPQEVAPR